jgi:hypothetical protein
LIRIRLTTLRALEGIAQNLDFWNAATKLIAVSRKRRGLENGRLFALFSGKLLV